MSALKDHFKAWKETLLVLSYFALLALFVPQAKKHNVGTGGMFFVMIGCGVLLAVVYYGIHLLRKWMQQRHISGREVRAYMSGSVAASLASQREDIGGSALVALDPRTLQETGTVSQPLTPYDEAALALVEEATDSDPDLPTEIIEENPVYLADTFQPDIRTILGAMLLLVGMRRSGKSNLLAVIFEEFAHWLLPFVIFDTEDEYQGLVEKQYLRRGIHVGSAALLQETPDLNNYVPIDLAGAYEFGKTIVEGSLQVVVNLRSWEDETAAKIMCEIIDGMNDWQNGRSNAKRVPVMIGLDEASKWLPQNLGDSYVSKETQALLHHAYFDMVVARGGKRGFGLVVATQRYSQINKNLLQSLWKFLFFQKEEVDLDRYTKLGIPKEATMSLQQGECIIFSPTVIGFKARIRRRHSPHEGHTPGLDNLFTHNRHMQPLSLVLNRSFVGNQSTMTSSSAFPENRMYGYQGLPTSKTWNGLVEQRGYPYHQNQDQYQTEGDIPTPEGSFIGSPGLQTTAGSVSNPGTIITRPQRRLTPKQQLALEVWRDGHTTIHDMANAMTQAGTVGRITPNEAYNIQISWTISGLSSVTGKAK